MKKQGLVGGMALRMAAAVALSILTPSFVPSSLSAAESKERTPKAQPAQGGPSAAEKPRGEHDHPDLETDPAAAERKGFEILLYNRYDDGTEAAEIIEKHMMPELAKGLPWPAPGFRYALKDLDGDGAPELFLMVKHYTLCEAGCPVRIYRFVDGDWKFLFARTAIMVALRPPQNAREKPQVAFIDNGPDVDLPTQTHFYRMEGDKFVPAGTVGARKK